MPALPYLLPGEDGSPQHAAWPTTTVSFECCAIETTAVTSTTAPVTISHQAAAATTTAVPHGSSGGLSPAAIGGIFIGTFFGFLLLVAVCICCIGERPNPITSRPSSPPSSPHSASEHKVHRQPKIATIMTGGGSVIAYGRRPGGRTEYVAIRPKKKQLIPLEP